MKQIIKIVLPVVFLLTIVSCNNDDWSFPDYDYTTVYFAYQSPVRTLVLGDYDLTDNTKDNNLQFSIGVRMGGVYANNEDRTVQFEIDESLVDNLINGDTGEEVVILPQSYYTLSSAGAITIPEGQTDGYVDVQLTQNFLNDTMAHTVYYVIPLRITSSQTDSILAGKPTVEDPDPRVATDWEIAPKDYTLYGIKYINAYHGKYLHRGKDILKDANGNVIEEIVYREKYIVDDEIWHLQTKSKNQVQVSSVLRRSAGGTSDDGMTMLLTFSDNNTCTITDAEESSYPITGSGKFVTDGDEWGGKDRDAIYINYEVNDMTNNEVHTITDTLVLRDRDVRLEEFAPVVQEKE